MSKKEKPSVNSVVNHFNMTRIKYVIYLRNKELSLCPSINGLFPVGGAFSATLPDEKNPHLWIGHPIVLPTICGWALVYSRKIRIKWISVSVHMQNFWFSYIESLSWYQYIIASLESKYDTFKQFFVRYYLILPLQQAGLYHDPVFKPWQQPMDVRYFYTNWAVHCSVFQVKKWGF